MTEQNPPPSGLPPALRAKPGLSPVPVAGTVLFPAEMDQRLWAKRWYGKRALSLLPSGRAGTLPKNRAMSPMPGGKNM